MSALAFVLWPECQASETTTTLQRRGAFSSGDKPNTFVDIEFNRTLVSHLQQERLAVFLIFDICSLHNLKNLQRLFSKSVQYFFSIGLRHVRSSHKGGQGAPTCLVQASFFSRTACDPVGSRNLSPASP
jgi:hypothetical protein